MERQDDAVIPVKISAGLVTVLLVLLLFSGSGNAASIMNLGHDFTSHDPARSVMVLHDPSGLLSADDVVAGSGWQAYETAPARLPRDGVVWLQMRIRNGGPARTVLLVMDDPLLARVGVYASIQGRPATVHETGARLPFASRPLDHRHFLFPLALEAGASAHVLVRLDSPGNALPAARLWSESAFHLMDGQRILLQGLFLGLLLIMVIYNGVIFLVINDRSFAWYSLFLFAGLLLAAAWQGFGYQYLWPSSPWIQNKVHILFLLLALGCICLFVSDFLSLRKHSLLLHMYFKVLAALTAVLMVASILLPTSMIGPFSMPVFGLVTFSTFMAGVVAYLVGHRAALYFIIASTSVVLGALVMILEATGLVSAGDSVMFAIQAGAAVGVMLWSLALADRINAERTDRFSAQALALKKERELREVRDQALAHANQAREAEHHALQLQRVANRHLGLEVRKRTEQLESVLLDLSAANARLEHASNTDGLTGLANRRHFDGMLKQEWKIGTRDRKPLSLLLVDLDFFKRINDEHGHQVGDACLQEAAAVLKRVASRPRDVAARYGGEEFVVILPETPGEGAHGIAQQIREQIKAVVPADPAAAGVRMTASVGLATVVPDACRTPEELLSAADAAVYRAKETGRDKVVVGGFAPARGVPASGAPR